MDGSGRAPDRGDFASVVRDIYLRGHAVVERLVSQLRRFQLDGWMYDERSVSLLDQLTRRTSGVQDARDLRNAVMVVLADLLTSHAEETQGEIQVPAIREQLDELEASFRTARRMAHYARSDLYRPDNPVTRNELVRFVSLFAPLRMGELLQGQDIPRRLDLIDYVQERVGTMPEDVQCLVGLQHLFGSTVPLIEGLARNRLEPDGVFLLGKPYSTNHATVWALRSNCGYYVHPGSYRYDGTGEYHTEADNHIEDVLHRASLWLHGRADNARAILIDDGGRAIRMLHHQRYRRVASRFVCVEQTRRGVCELADVDLKLPVVNVAESDAKLVHESPMIAWSVRKELMTSLAAVEAAGVPIRKRALIVGYGYIGAAIADALRKAEWEIAATDTDAEKLNRARDCGLPVEEDLKRALPAYGVIIGCTGTTVLRPEDYTLLADSTVLASASSSDLEFSGWELRSMATRFSHDHRFVDDYNLVHERFGSRLLYLGDTDHPCHFLYVVRIAGRRVLLLNGGFPINMTGDIDPIPAYAIQLTRALLYAGAVEATRHDRPGLHELDLSVQGAILERFEGEALKLED